MIGKETICGVLWWFVSNGRTRQSKIRVMVVTDGQIGQLAKSWLAIRLSTCRVVLNSHSSRSTIYLATPDAGSTAFIVPFVMQCS